MKTGGERAKRENAKGERKRERMEGERGGRDGGGRMREKVGWSGYERG